MIKYYACLLLLSGCTLSVITTAPMHGAKEYIETDQDPENDLSADVKVPVGA